MKLNIIPIPRCYDNPLQFSGDYSEDISCFRERLPEFSNWSDEQVVAFGNDYAVTMCSLCAFQKSGINPEQMRNVALAMAILDCTMEDLGKYADEIDWHAENGTWGIWDILNSVEYCRSLRNPR